MQVSVEELGGLERRLTVQLPAARIEQEIEQRLQDLSRRVKLDGFRPGKVPLKVVKRMYGGQVRQEVLGELMQSSFQEAVSGQNLRPAAGLPNLTVASGVTALGLELEGGRATGVRLAGKAPFATFPGVFGGRYGLSSKDLTPSMVASVYAELSASKPRRRFTVGIYDDVTQLSLPPGPPLSVFPPDVFQALFKHPLTEKGLQQFLADWAKTGQSIL